MKNSVLFQFCPYDNEYKCRVLGFQMLTLACVKKHITLLNLITLVCCATPVAQHMIHTARRTLSDVQLTQYDILPQR